MEINIPLDKAIGGTLLLFCLTSAALSFRKQLVNAVFMASKVPQNLWHSKKTLTEVYGVTLLPHALIITLFGFSPYLEFFGCATGQRQSHELVIIATGLTCIITGVIFLAVSIGCSLSPQD